VKITKREIRFIVRKLIREQFTIPTHSKHSGFELFTGAMMPNEFIDDFEEECLDEIVDGIGDDPRAGEGGLVPGAEPEDGS